MKHKSRIFTVFCAVLLCMSMLSVTAFADGYFASDENGNATPPDAIDDITVNTEGVNLPENQGDEALTPDGNMTLIDDILQEGGYFVSDEQKVANKQFITVQSKNGNYFYLVIDRSGDTENVYFLNLVDEADLLALMEEAEETTTPTCSCTDKCVVGAIKTDCEICRSNMSECIGKEKVTDTTPDPTDEPDREPDTDDKKDSDNTAVIALVVLLIAGGGGALYWFKFRGNKPDTKGANNLDDYDYGEDDEDEDYEYESDESENEEENNENNETM